MVSLVLRLCLAVLLVLGGLLPSAPAVAATPAPCHDLARPHAGHMAHAASGAEAPCPTSHDHPGHCVVLGNACCTLVVPMAAIEAVQPRSTSEVTWETAEAQTRDGLRAEPVTPPPRA